MWQLSPPSPSKSPIHIVSSTKLRSMIAWRKAAPVSKLFRRRCPNDSFPIIFPRQRRNGNSIDNLAGVRDRFCEYYIIIIIFLHPSGLRGTEVQRRRNDHVLLSLKMLGWKFRDDTTASLDLVRVEDHETMAAWDAKMYMCFSRNGHARRYLRRPALGYLLALIAATPSM